VYPLFTDNGNPGGPKNRNAARPNPCGDFDLMSTNALNNQYVLCYRYTTGYQCWALLAYITVPNNLEYIVILAASGLSRQLFGLERTPFVELLLVGFQSISQPGALAEKNHALL
jgi:hypothetical protein